MKKKWLTYATKGVVALALFAIVVAPLQGMVPVAHAQVASTTPAGTADQTSCWTSSWGTCVANVVYVFTVGLMSIFAYIGSYIFNIAIQITLSSITYSQQFVTDGWVMVRDLANMAFIFMLVYLALTIIFKADPPGAMRALAAIVIVALLINFSFFITRVVIDGGNILSTQFYNAIKAPSMAESAQGSGVVGAVASTANAISPNSGVKDLTANIMNLINVQNLLGSQSFAAFANSIKGTGGVAGSVGGGFGVLITLSFVYIAVAAILAMLAFTFMMVGIKFLMRIVILWFVIIAAPLALVARALPMKAANELYGKWQGALIQQSLYPAVFLFLFLIINLFAGQLGASVAAISGANGGLLAAGFSQGASAASAGSGALVQIATVISSIAIRLAIVVGMLYLAMRASEKFAQTGVGAVDKFSGRAGKWISQTMPGRAYSTAGGAAARTGGVTYQQLVGRGAAAASSGLARTNIGNSYLGYRLRKNVLEPMAGAKVGGARNFTDFKKARDERRKETRGNLRDMQIKEDAIDLAAISPLIQPLIEREKAQKDLDKTNARITALTSGPITPAEAIELASLRTSAAGLSTIRGARLTAAENTQLIDGKAKIAAYEKTINNMSKGELEKFKTAELQPIVKFMKESQIRKLEDSDKFNDAEKERLRDEFNNTSSDSSLGKAQNIVDQMRQMNEKLQASNVILADMDTAIGTRSSPKPGNRIDSDEIEKMRAEIVRSTAATQESLRVALTPDERVIHRQNLRNLQVMNTQLEKLDEERAKVQARVGGEPEAGKFKTA